MIILGWLLAHLLDMSKEAMDARQAHEPPTNWLHNILGLQEDVRPLFQADNEVAEIHGKVVPGVRSVDESRAKDIQNTRESLRGARTERVSPVS